ncbi:MAG: hypothetical protein J6D27_09420 [Ruminiclostridium sp.]|nr:hypothetical protein [Ruminiclostridium sp.]
MELLDKKIKEYIASVSVPDEIKPSKIKQFIEDSGEITAGKFLKKLREMKISGSEFLELLGNSRIGNIAYRRIEENPHLRFDELLQILDSSELTHEDYSAMLNVAMTRRKQSEDRKKREEETLRRVSLEEKGVAIPVKEEEKKPAPPIAEEAKEDMSSSPAEVLAEAPTEEKTVEKAEVPVEELIEETTESSSDDEDVAEEETGYEAPAEIVADISESVISDTDYTESIEETVDECSSSVESGTNEVVSEEKTEDERTAAAEALIAKIQASINSSIYDKQKEASETTESVKEYINYTESIEEAFEKTEETPEETEEPAPVAESEVESATEESDEESEVETNTQTSYDNDPDDEETEEIGSSAKEIGDVLNDLLDKDDDSEEYDEDEDAEDEEDEDEEKPVTKKSKGFLIAAFICAAIVIGCAGALKLLRYYEIIPNYVFKIPDIIKQDIVDFPSLLEEVKEAEHKIGYTLPDSFITESKKPFTGSKNTVGETVCLALTKKESEYYITGAALDNGKVGQSFSFAVGMNDVSLQYSNGYFIVVGSVNNMTEARFYKESNISEGKAEFSYRQSGKYTGYYTDGNAFYMVTENHFNLLDAKAEKLTSFIPSFEVNGNLSVVPFDRIAMPEYAARTNYCTVSRLPFDMGQTKVRAVLMGDASGYHISEKGLFTCDNTYLNENYRSRITAIFFDEELTVKSTDIDGAINPSMLMSGGDNLLAVGIAKVEKETENAVYKFDTALSSAPEILSPIAKDSSFEKMICGDDVLTLITAGDKPMQYNINISDLSSAEKGASAKNKKKISDSLYASINVSFNDSGKRTGIVLTVGDDESSASVTANVKKGTISEWDAYLDTPFITDISDLPYYESGDGIIVGLPLTFFDGISQVGEYRFYKYSNNSLAEIGRISLYDQKFTTVYCGFTSGEKPCILTLWDNKVITADIEKVKIISESEITG